MKALLLAAGLGTRLRPYTHRTPKALFPLNGQPLLDRHIRRLQQSGCTAVTINTHHLSAQIERFLQAKSYSIDVSTCHEPDILGTGGAIKNLSDFWDAAPFMVVNSDIVTDIDLADVYRFHMRHQDPVTLVLHDYPRFNQVSIAPDETVTAFGARPTSAVETTRTLAFTGIHVIDPQVLELISPGDFVDIIDTYRRMLAENRIIRAYIARKHYWRDIGTPASYRKTAFEQMAPTAFNNAFGDGIDGAVTRTKLQGDGSERTWYRLKAGSRTLILGDHGLHGHARPDEVDAFIAIGEHLSRHGIPVPKIYAHDAFSGQVYLEDLGDTHLQNHIQQLPRAAQVISAYQQVIDMLIQMWRHAAENFDPAWAYQTPEYSLDLVVEKECRYFVEAFLQGYLGWETAFEPYREEFEGLAQNAVTLGLKGFLHRDFQSRNIMVTDQGLGVIDFQGGRLGPLQYDLAALLIDPYVSLPPAVQKQLFDYAIDQLAKEQTLDRECFVKGYRYCAVTRNLQMLGAFGFLSQVKHKHYFEQYIPTAVKSLKQNVKKLDPSRYPKLVKLIRRL